MKSIFFSVLCACISISSFAQSSVGFNSQQSPSILSSRNLDDLVRVYPNPCKERIFVMNQSGKTVVSTIIYNLNGVKVFAGENPREINTSAFRPGRYLVEIRFSDNTLVRKNIIRES